MSYYAHYNRWHPETSDHRDKMIEFYTGLFWNTLHNLPRGAALDAGCGTGIMLEYLIRNGFDPVAGYDAEQEMVDLCTGRRLNVICSNSPNAVLTIGSEFQVISALDFLEHLSPDECQRTCKNFHASLKSGGVFICTVPNANSVLAERWRYIDPTHRTSFTEHTIDFLLKESGFTTVSISPAEWPLKIDFKSWSRFVSSLRLRAARSFRRFQLVAELGEEGRRVPLSLNLMAVAWK